MKKLLLTLALVIASVAFIQHADAKNKLPLPPCKCTEGEAQAAAGTCDDSAGCNGRCDCMAGHVCNGVSYDMPGVCQPG